MGNMAAKNRAGTGFVLLLIILCLNGASCTSIPSRRVSQSGEMVAVEKPLGVAATLRFEDVPIPAGFNIVRDQSFVYQDSAIRVGLLRYTGRANASQIILFFKSQMTLYNWSIMNVVEFGNITLNFIKGEESCVITVEPLTTKSLVNIVISPKSGTLRTGFSSAFTSSDTGYNRREKY